MVRTGALLALVGGLSAADALAAVLPVPSDEYGTIQAAVDAALPGDVVRVRPGTYAERVRIVRPGIRLEADLEQAAVLDGSTFTDAVAAIALVGTEQAPLTDVSVVGLRIENQPGPGISLSFAERCRILSNRVDNTGTQSIVLTRSRSNTIAGNTLSNGSTGIAMSVRSTENTLKENLIFGAFTHGIRVSMVATAPLPQPPLRNMLKENVICVQDAGALTGVLIAGFASENTVKENWIVGNGASTAGIRLEAPTTGNVVKENILNGHAIDVDDLGTGNTVKENVRHRRLRCP